ncbi:MAG: serine/threonine-protein kinase [Parasphingorhabdus sp.]
MVDPDPSIELAAMELFEQAMEQPAEERESYISDNSSAAEETRRRALELLSVNAGALASLKTGGATDLDEEEEIHPEQIGAYRILRLLGKGGMGAVYMAERMSDDFDHVAAIKLVKPGLLSASLVERFRRERQLLAQLNHKNIARLYDGGETKEGSPFIVMEYIDGVPLSEWLETLKPDIAERLSLFAQICEAVEYAHQNLVIHRDLTPSNVLIDEAGQVKLIDFGIARIAAEDDATDNQASTFTGLSLTPGYAAPERSKGAAANTLSDVFSLGRLLTLLTGNSRKDELVAIAAKACSSDPDERYATAGALNEDITRFRTGHAVHAKNSGLSYQISKFVMRQKMAVTLGGLIVIALCGGMIGTYIQYSRADQRFNDVRTLANTMMFDIYDEISSVPGGSSAEIKLAEASQKYLDDLAAQTSADPDLQLEAARGFIRLSNIQGSPSSGARKRIKEAKTNLIAAEKLLLPLLKADPENADVRYELNRVYYLTADMAIFNDLNVQAAFPAIQKAISTLEDAKDFGPLNIKIKTALISSKSMLSLAYGKNAQPDEALKIAQEVKRDNLNLAREAPQDKAVQRQVAISLNNLGRQFVNIERYSAARDLYSEAIAVMEGLLASAPDNDLYQRDMAYTLWRRATAYSKMKEGQASLSDFNEAVRIMAKLVRKDPSDSNFLSFHNAIKGESMLAYKHLKQYAVAEKIGRQHIADSDSFSRKYPDDKIAIEDKLVAYKNLIGLFDESHQYEKMCQMIISADAHLAIMEEEGILTKLEKKQSLAFDEQKKRCDT